MFWRLYVPNDDTWGIYDQKSLATTCVSRIRYKNTYEVPGKVLVTSGCQSNILSGSYWDNRQRGLRYIFNSFQRTNNPILNRYLYHNQGHLRTYLVIFELTLLFVLMENERSLSDLMTLRLVTVHFWLLLSKTYLGQWEQSYFQDTKR